MSVVEKPRADHVELSYLQAIVQGQIEELDRDERVILLGEDLRVYGDGKVVDRFGPSRIWSTPISETSFTGVGIGAAISGLRPIVALHIASFMYLASDPIINQAAKLPYMTGGKVKVPAVFRCSQFYARGLGAQHSDRPYPSFLNVPGLKIISPSAPADIKGLLKSAVRDDDPVIIFEDASLWPLKGSVPIDPEHLVPIGKGDIKRAGSDVTIVAISGAMPAALQAADALAAEGVSVEVLDPRTLKPLDLDLILNSVAKTGRLVLAENAHPFCGLTSEIAASVASHGFYDLKRPIQRVTPPDVHIPYSPALEKNLYVTKDKIVSAVNAIA